MYSNVELAWESVDHNAMQLPTRHYGRKKQFAAAGLNGLMNQANTDKARAVKRPVAAAWRFHLMLFCEEKVSPQYFHRIPATVFESYFI